MSDFQAEASDFQIDELRLEQEWLRQSDLLRKYSAHAAECMKTHDEAKATLEVAESECDSMLRKNPAKYGLSKPTEKAIENKIPLMAKYQEATQAVIDARYEWEMAKSAVATMTDKKRSLTCLVDLWTSEYYSEPRTRNATKEPTDIRGVKRRRKPERDTDS